MSALRLLMVCWGDPFRSALGTEIYVGNLAKALSHSGHEVHVIYGDPGGQVTDDVIENVSVHPMPTVNVPYLRTLTFRRRSANFCVNIARDFDAVVVFGAGSYPYILFRKIRKLASRQLLVYYAMDSMRMEYLRGARTVDGLSRKFVRWFRYIALIRSDKASCIGSDLVIASSADTASHLQSDYGIPSDKIAVLHEGVPESFSSGILTSEPVDPTYLHIGGPRKGTDLFFGAVRVLKEKYGLRTKVLVTRATENDMAEAKRLDIEGHIFAYVSKEQLREFFASCTVLVSPSYTEGFCLPVVEAMMFGKPAVVSNAGSLPELVEDGETGFVVPVGDVDRLAERMYRITVDRELRQGMGQKAKERSSRFALEEVSSRFVQLLEGHIVHQ
jgi:glycosyltransferase involved in cell wall biosynthesis